MIHGTCPVDRLEVAATKHIGRTRTGHTKVRPRRRKAYRRPGHGISPAYRECSLAGGRYLPRHLAPRVRAFQRERTAGTAGGGCCPVPGRRRGGLPILLHGTTDLFVGEHKYWLMTPWHELEADSDYVINRAQLYRACQGLVTPPKVRPEDRKLPMNEWRKDEHR